MFSETSYHRRRQGATTLVTWAVLVLTASLMVGCPSLPAPQPPSSAVGPGLNIAIEEILFPVDLRPKVTFTATDDLGNIIPLNEFTDVRFTLAYLEPASGAKSGLSPRYLSYSINSAGQSSYDPARIGGATQNADGTIGYKFETVLPAAFRRGATHQLGGQFRRTWVVDGQTYNANELEVFRPDNGTVTRTREISDTETCNECHTRLSIHGSRREFQYCILCHNDQTIDPESGNTVDFPELIHKIHRGADLPSVEAGDPYQIIGHRDSVHDYSDVEFPQDIRNCEVCHRNSAKAAQADIYKDGPSLAGCASCHDRTWFGNQDATPEDYENHIGGQQVDDSVCALCHTPTAPGVSPIVEAHLIPTDSGDAPGLALDITDVNIIPEKQASAVQIVVTVADGAGNPVTALSALTRLRAIMGLYSPEYESSFREDLLTPDGVIVNNGDGSYDYTFARRFPSDSTETFAVGLEGRVEFEFRGETERQGTSSNGLTFFTLAKADPEVRRTVVTDEKCNKCHREIRFHGGSRFGVDYCVICHNPNLGEAEEDPPYSANFKDLIHRLHTGVELGNPFAIGSHVYNDGEGGGLRFPGDRRECEICHEEGTYELPLPDEAISTLITQDDTIISDTLPTRAACTSCHDSLAAGIHALLNTDVDLRIETCIVCHGEDADFAVEVVHDMGP